MIVIDEGRHRFAAVFDDDPDAEVRADTVIQVYRPAGTAVAAVVEVRAVVEVLRALGGAAVRALVGGRYRGEPGDEITVRVPVTHPDDGAWPPEGATSMCASRVSRGQNLIVGMPAHFAGATAEGLAEGLGEAVPGGTVTVDRAAFHEVDSSAAAFWQAAHLLGSVLAARVRGEDGLAAAREVMQAW